MGTNTYSTHTKTHRTPRPAHLPATHISEKQQAWILEQERLQAKGKSIKAYERSQEADEYICRARGAERSEVSKPHSRQNRLLDKYLLLRMAKILKNGGIISLTNKEPKLLPSRCIVKPLSMPETDKTSKKECDKKDKTTLYIGKIQEPIIDKTITKTALHGKEVHKVYLPTWDHVTAPIKIMAYSAAMVPLDCRAFTLKLSNKVIKQAAKSKRGFAAHIQDRLSRSFRKNVFPLIGSTPTFWFAIEGWEEEEPFHIHGVIDCSCLKHMDSRTSILAMDAIKAALREAGGEWDADSKARQLDMRPLYDPVGWAAYVTKRYHTTYDQLNLLRHRLGCPTLTKGESLYAASTQLRRRGKKWFEIARKSEAPLLRSLEVLKD